jgi:PAS domain S-box-containing protein
LRESEEKFRLLAETSPAAILIYQDGTLVYLNPAVESITGYGCGELLGKGLSGIIHPDYRQKVEKLASWRTQGQGLPACYELKILTKDGQERWMNISSVSILYGSSPAGLVVAFDITEHKRAEAALRESEARLASELAATRQLQEISTQLIQEENVEALYDKILDAAVAIMHSDFASLQMLYPEREAGGELRLLGHRGFTPEAARFWEWVRPASESTCGIALRTWERVIAPDVQKCEFMAGSEDLKTCLQTGIRAVQTTPLISRSGSLVGMISTHWREVHEPTEHELGLLDLLARQAADLIERSQAQEALRQSEARYRAVGETIPYGVWLADVTGLCTYVREHWLRCVATGENFEREHRVRTKEGSYRHVLAVGRPLRNEQGQITSWVGINLDITVCKQAEEALKESEFHLAQAQQMAHLGSWSWDLAQGRLYWSDETYRLYGLQPGECVPRHEDFLGFVHPEDRPQVEKVVREALAHGGPRALDFRIVQRGGEERYVHCEARTVLDPEGHPTKAEGALQDVTERRRAEKVLRELNVILESKVAERTAELEQRNRQLQKLTLELTQAEDRERQRIASLLHEDLQQHLAGVKFHLHMLKRQTRNDPHFAVLEDLDAMLKEAIEKSRTLSHDLSPAVLHLNDLGEVLHWLAMQMQTRHGLTVHLEVPGGTTLPSEALTMFLFRAAQEILFNVSKHAGVREATIRARGAGRYVYLSVTDRGCGFDPQALQGTDGFGLLSIRERVDLLGGRMKIRSTPGRGTTVVIALARNGTLGARQETPSG